MLDTALDVASAMQHLHALHIVHGDLKARNILLKTVGHEARGAKAMVADFGLSMKVDHMETHLSNMFHGTMCVHGCMHAVLCCVAM